MEIIAGLIYRGQIRRYLAQAEFYSHVSRWAEIKGFTESKFLIDNPSQEVRNYLQDMIDRITLTNLSENLERSRLQREKEKRRYNRWYRRLYRWITK